MIVFERIKWSNFLATGNVATEINLNSNSNTLVIGKNGAGKSTLLDAICYVLYGSPYRNINKPQLVNTINGKSTLVEIWFTISNVKYYVRRGIKPGVFEIYKNDKLVDQDSRVKDYQDILTKILGMSFKSFKQIVILGSASFTPFMQLPALDRRQVTEDILEIEIFSKMFVLHKANMEKISKQLDEIEHKISLVQQELDLTLAHSEDKRKELLSLAEAQKVKRGLMLIHISRLKEEEAELEVQTHALHEKMRAEYDITKLRGNRRQLLDFKVRFETETNRLQNDRKFFHDNEKCPTCKQMMTMDYKATIVAELGMEASGLAEKIQLAKNKITYLDSKIFEYEELEETSLDTNKDLEEKRNEIHAATKSADQLLREYQHLVNKSNEINTGSIDEIRNRLVELKEQRISIIEKLEMYKTSTMILKDSGIKTRIIRQYIPIINKYINKYLAAMDFFVSFELDDTFKETIRSRHRDAFSYESFSEGEKMRINLAVLFTWRAIASMRNSASTNLLIMDEVFDSSLDVEGTDEFMKLLNNLTGGITTFIISHKSDQLLDKFENVIKFEKYKEFSRIVE